MTEFDWQAQNRRIEEQEARAWAIARECYGDFVSARGRADLSAHHLYRLHRMLTLAEKDEEESIREFGRLPSGVGFEKREVRKFMGMKVDHAWCIANSLRREIQKRVTST